MNLVSVSDKSSVQTIISDASGNSIAVWSRVSDSFSRSLLMSRYTADVGWSTIERPADPDTGDWQSSAFDPDGNILTLWRSSLGLQARQYTPGSGWGSAHLIDSGYAESARIAVDANGNAFAVWEKPGSLLANIWSNHRVAGGEWSSPELIEVPVGLALAPQVALDGQGNAIAAWIQLESPGGSLRFRTNRYTAGTGWGTNQALDTGASSAAYSQIGFDANGNALAVFTNAQMSAADSDTFDSIRSVRYSSTSGWGSYKLIDTLTPAATPGAEFPSAGVVQLSVEPSGRALATWDRQVRSGTTLIAGLGVYFSRYL